MGTFRGITPTQHNMTRQQEENERQFSYNKIKSCLRQTNYEQRSQEFEPP
jgi:hypothetical protein